MPSKRIIEFAQKFGMPLSMERNAAYGFVWNGKDLALYSYEFDRQWDAEPYMRIMEDWEVLHELAHWLVATPEEREIFEYGCDPVMTEYLASGYKVLGSPRTNGPLSPALQEERERAAYFLGMLFCYDLGVNFPRENHPTNSVYFKERR